MQRGLFFGSFVFNVEIVFYYALLCCPLGDNTCYVGVGVEFISTRIPRVIRAKTPQKAGFRFAQQASPLRVIIRCRLLKTVPIHGDNYKIYSSKDVFLFLSHYQCVCTHTSRLHKIFHIIVPFGEWEKNPRLQYDQVVRIGISVESNDLWTCQTSTSVKWGVS